MITDHFYEISLYTDYKTTVNLLSINQSCYQLKPWQRKLLSYGTVKLNSNDYKKEFKLLENCYLLSTRLIGLYQLLNNKDNMAMYILDHKMSEYYWVKDCQLYHHMCPKMMIRNTQCCIEIGGKVISYTEQYFTLFFTLLFYHYPDVCIEDDYYSQYLYKDMGDSLYNSYRRHYWEKFN